jgi:hypothetical protein
MGFTAIAFRAGSEKKKRTHIFWQKRIRAGDATTPWWYPCETRGGAMDAARIALPIPPGVHWSEVQGAILPAESCQLSGESCQVSVVGCQEEAKPRRVRKEKPAPVPTLKRGPFAIQQSRMSFAPPGVRMDEPKAKAKKTQKAKPRATFNPAVVSAARELRDRYLEQGTIEQTAERAKYDVARIPAPMNPTKLLAA